MRLPIQSIGRQFILKLFPKKTLLGEGKNKLKLIL